MSAPPHPLHRTTAPRLLLLGLSAVAASCTPPDAGRADPIATAYLAIVAAEDARPADGPDLRTLLRGSMHPDERIRRTAIRAIGRLENPNYTLEIARHLGDPDPGVRAQAADAVAQSVHGHDGTLALTPLLASASTEHDPGVLASVARSLARLDVGDDERARVVETVLDLSRSGGGFAPVAQLEGVAMGLEALARARVPLGNRARGRLADLLAYDAIAYREEPRSSRVRAVALMALARLGELTSLQLAAALSDESDRVRLAAAQNLGAIPAAARTELVRRGLGDRTHAVRLAAVRRLVADGPNETTCEWLVQVATVDPTRAVRLAAMDGLGGAPCRPDAEAQRNVLVEAASSLDAGTVDDWQVPAHALVALASHDAAAARPLLPTYVNHQNPFVRQYGLRAADALGEAAAVRSMAGDPDANVRTLALQRLAAVDAVTDQMLVAQLSADDSQLLMTVAGLLEASPLGLVAASACLNAFERVSRAQRETSRDARRALLRRVGELGDRSLIQRLEPFLTDFDPLVAGDVARVLRGWTGQAYTPDPQPLPRLPLPSVAELGELERTVVVLHMRRGGEIHVMPLPWLALTNSHRFVRQAREGYLDGLTFHRWAPNFVIQGGSPGANEYSGDGPFTRDEVGTHPHWRGTVGLSTRGRDTGDGQIFVNLADNIRLDHDYTVHGVVVGSMDTVDRVVEGDVIERAEVRIAN